MTSIRSETSTAEAVDPTTYYLCRFGRADALRATGDDGEAVGIEVLGLPAADADPGADAIPFRFVLSSADAMRLVGDVVVEMTRLGDPVAREILEFLVRLTGAHAGGPGHGPA